MNTLRRNPTGAEPVLLSDIKQHLRLEIDETDQDIYLQDLLASAIAYAEHETHRCLIETTITLTLRYNQPRVKLPLGLIEDTIEVGKGSKTFTEEVDYYVDYESGFLVFLGQRDTNGYVVTYDTGFTDASLPADLRHAILMVVETMRQNSGDTTYGVQSFKAPFASKVLLEKHRLY